jgi:hypothetical protein
MNVQAISRRHGFEAIASAVGTELLFPYWRELVKLCKRIDEKHDVLRIAVLLQRQHFGFDAREMQLLVDLIDKIDGWIAGSTPIKSLKRYPTNVVKGLHRLFPIVLNRPLYYANEKIRISHRGKLCAGEKIIRTRANGIMNWSHARPVTSSIEDTVIFATIPIKYVLFANTDQRLVKRVYNFLNDNISSKCLEVDRFSYAIACFCEHLIKFDHEREVITYGLKNVKCVVQK